MLVVSFIALLTGCLCLCGEMAQYEWDFKAAGAKVPPEPLDNTPPPAMPAEAAPPPAAENVPPATPPAAEAPAAPPM
jgi:hypothetical protein